MKILFGIFGTIAALAGTFIGMPALLIGSTGFGGSGSSAMPAQEIVAMITQSNAKRATNLTISQRKIAKDLCMATFRSQRKPGLVDEDNTTQLIKSLEKKAGEKCGCMISTIAGETNLLAFSMAMSMRFVVAKDLDIDKIDAGQDINHSAFDDIAQKVSVSENDMKKMRISSLNAVVAAMDKCR